MDGGLTRTAELSQADLTPSFLGANGSCWVRRALTATILIGLIWRVVRYVGSFPIWGDEAMLLLNILDRNYVGLTHHLDYSQVAPLFFLWLEKTAILTLGCSEWSVHLFPMLAGLSAFLLFAWTCRSSFSPLIAGLAVGILAVSYYPVRHGSEVKPYVFDLLFSVQLAGLALQYLRNPQQRWLALLVLTTPLAVFSSYPSVFVGGAVSLVLLTKMREASWTQRGLYVLYNLVLVGSFLVHFGMVGHQQIDAAEAQRTREFLRNYWKDAFPPEDWQHWPLWLLRVFTGNMLAYPLGANHGGSTLTFLLVLLGSIALWRRGERTLLALCWLPFALNLVAAILGKYPFGDSARITLHLAPFICILMAHGTAYLLENVKNAQWRMRLHLAFCTFLLGCGIAGIVRDLMKPYKTEHDREVRRVVHDLASDLASDEPVFVCHHNDKALLAEMSWYLRTELPCLCWSSDTASRHENRKSVCLFFCANHAPCPAEALRNFPWAEQGWENVTSSVSLVPGENAKMSPVYCCKVRLMRD